ncbi:MAG: DHH family phosphoesterase [Candidatus Nanoarchaeia archaeon]
MTKKILRDKSLRDKRNSNKHFGKDLRFRGSPRREGRIFEEKPKRPEKNSIIDLNDGDFYKGSVKILRRAQPGPVIFSVSDGYGIADAVTKESDFKEGDIVDLAGFVNQRAGKLQIEIFRMEHSKFDFDKILDKNSEPVERQPSISSERYEKLKPYFYSIAKRIRKAIFEDQSIMIRHHADSDGICAGLSIEQACKSLMKKIGINPEYNLYRSPSKAPFYEVSDVFRDVVLSKRLIEGHGQKKPLIVVLDNGSTPEDVLGLKVLNSLGFEVIVIDHHNPVIINNKKTAVDPYLSLHLNPYIEGLDSKTSAGMLAYEVARLIFDKYDSPLIPAVAGISDRCDIQETEEYIKNSGSSREYLEKIGIAIDFIAYNLKYDAGKGLFEELFDNKSFVESINQQVKKGIETQLQSTIPYLRTQDIEGVILSSIDLEKYTMRFTYPTPGKVIGLLHDRVSAEHEEMPVISLGVLPEMIIVRATKPVLPVAKIIEKLQADLPQANVEGGGHECAGAIKFVTAHQEEIISNIKEQVKNLKYLENKEE